MKTILLESPCSSKPCLNGGKCKDADGSFTCDCRSGYKGKRCQNIGKIVLIVYSTWLFLKSFPKQKFQYIANTVG